ncbi:MAG: DUF4252 domain-containing protein [Dysgonamonadaceae bacterium]|nr:DUF4252 domain-containing protein [Dysgonamonadaceae bacterium]
MKQLLILFLLMAPFVPAHGQGVVSQFVEQTGKLKNGAMLFNISGKMLKMAMEAEKNKSEEDKELEAFLSNVKKMSILIGQELNDDSRKRINALTKPFEELLSVTEENTVISMLTLEKDGKTVEFVMQIIAGDTLVMLDIVGIIDITQLAKLSEGFEINGAEYLKNLDKLKEKDKKKK